MHSARIARRASPPVWTTTSASLSASRSSPAPSSAAARRWRPVPDVADPAVDQAVIAEVLESTGGDREFLGELIATYLDDVPRQLTALREAASSGSAEGVGRAAHALKGASASLGAGGFAERSRLLELAARAGRLDDAGDQIRDPEAEFQRVG